MKNLIATMLRVTACLESFECQMVRSIPMYTKTLLFKLYSLPGIVHYKSLGGLKLLREVGDILDSLGLTSFVVGGYAYDIAAGKITRYHKDLDIAVLADRDMEPMHEAFARHGFHQAVRDVTWCKVKKHGLAVDVFYYRPSDPDSILTRSRDKCVRMPRSCFSWNTKYLHGHAYKVASDAFNVCIEPFILNKNSIDYVARLKRNSPLTCRSSKQQVTETVTMYDFQKNPTKGVGSLLAR